MTPGRVSLRHGKKGDMPIAMMLLQIAIIIAAGVIIGTMIQHAKEGTREAALDRTDIHGFSKTEVEIKDIVGKGGKDRDLETLLITVEAGEISDPVKLEDLTVIINQQNVTSVLRYRNGSLERNISSGYFTE